VKLPAPTNFKVSAIRPDRYILRAPGPTLLSGDILAGNGRPFDLDRDSKLNQLRSVAHDPTRS